jgi:hypothetical protein
MSPFTCSREKEVAELLHQGHWPQVSAEELRAHVQVCRNCSDLVLVTHAFQAARMPAANALRLESAGALWWRAQLRRRNAAIEQIGKPILGAQIFALTMVALVGAGALAWQIRRGFHPASWFDEWPRALHLDALLPGSSSGLDGGFWFWFPILATLALVSGMIVYFSSEKN